jgi:hypothetical protein
MRTRLIALSVLPIVVAGSLAAGCSSDDDDGNTPNTAPAEIDGGEADTGGTGQTTATVSDDLTGGTTGATQGNQIPGGSDDTTPSTADGAGTDG